MPFTKAIPLLMNMVPSSPRMLLKAKAQHPAGWQRLVALGLNLARLYTWWLEVSTFKPLPDALST